MRGPALVLFLCACSPARFTPDVHHSAAIDAAAGTTDATLAKLFRRHWDWQMRTDPVWATQLGDHRFDAEMPSATEAAHADQDAAEARFLEEARAIDASSLVPADRVHCALFIEMLEGDLATRVCKMERWDVSTFNNEVLGWNNLPEEHPVTSVADGRNLVARYRQIPRVIDEDLANLRKGLAEGRIATAGSLKRVITQVKDQLAQPDDKWMLLSPLHKQHTGWSASDEEAFARDLRAAVKDGVRPAWERYLALLENELLPHARSDDHAGVGALPDGAACYAAMIRYHTGLERDPATLHQLGLDEMKRIHGEMRQIAASLFHTDDLAVVFDKLRKDPGLHFHSADEIMKKAQASLAAARARIPQFFGTLPKTRCVVKEIPSYQSAFSTIAYYNEPREHEPGELRVNVSAPESRPSFEAAVLAFHESIPGHHLQIARAQELPAMPAFRRYLGLTAFVEGWALYSERLADEMGLYAGDADRLGMLDYDAWRAARLVVDTGLHAMGWSRQQAIDYMKENTALAENNIVNEVDRYISAPGQALAYKLGQLEILKLRAEAKKALGARFDIKQFHDVVLGGGAVSLQVLDDEVEGWLHHPSTPGR